MNGVTVLLPLEYKRLKSLFFFSVHLMFKETLLPCYTSSNMHKHLKGGSLRPKNIML